MGAQGTMRPLNNSVLGDQKSSSFWCPWCQERRVCSNGYKSLNGEKLKTVAMQTAFGACKCVVNAPYVHYNSNPLLAALKQGWQQSINDIYHGYIS
jgi:hypothetical protein